MNTSPTFPGQQQDNEENLLDSYNHLSVHSNDLLRSKNQSTTQHRFGTENDLTYHKKHTLGDNPMTMSNMSSQNHNVLMHSIEEQSSPQLEKRKHASNQGSNVRCFVDHDIKETQQHSSIESSVEHNPNEHSNDFIMRTMIPSSQRATKEYKNKGEMMAQQPPNHELDIVQAQLSANYYTSGGGVAIAHKKKMPSDVRYNVPHNIEEYSDNTSQNDYQEVQMSSNQPLLLNQDGGGQLAQQILSNLQSFVEQQPPIKKDMKTMLKELSMKKDKMLKDRFQQNQAMAEVTSSFNQKKDSTLKTGSTAYLGPRHGKYQKFQNKDHSGGVPMKIVVKVEESDEVNHHECLKEYELGQYKHACQTCKMMRDYQDSLARNRQQMEKPSFNEQYYIQQIEYLRVELNIALTKPCPICGFSKHEIANIQRNKQAAELQQARIQKCLSALREAQTYFQQLGQVSNDVKKQSATTIDKSAKNKLIDISIKLKGASSDFQNRFEYLINEIEELQIPELAAHKDHQGLQRPQVECLNQQVQVDLIDKSKSSQISLELAALQVQLDTYQTQITHFEAEIQDKDDLIAELKQDKKQLKELLDSKSLDSNFDHQTLLSKIEQLQSLYDHAQSALDEQIREKARQEDANQLQILNLNTQLSSLQTEKERKITTMTEQITVLEESNQILEHAHESLKVQKETQINQIIQEKVLIEQKLQETRMLLNRVEGMLKDEQKFQELQNLVSKIQSFIMVNKSGVTRFEQDDKLLISELFSIKPEDIGTLMPNSPTMVDSDLILKSIEELENHRTTLQARKDELSNLHDCTQLFLMIDDSQLIKEAQQLKEKTFQRFESAQFNVLQSEIDFKIEEIDEKMQVLNNMLIRQSKEGLKTPKKNKTKKNDRNTFSTRNNSRLGQSLTVGTIVPALNIIKVADQELNRPQVALRHQKRSQMKSGDLSFMQKQFLQEAIDDPEFMEEFMGNHDNLSQRSKHQYLTTETPTQKEQLNRQDRLKHQINDSLAPKQRRLSANLSQNNQLLRSTNSKNKLDFNRGGGHGVTCGESGINFFNNVDNEQNSFEVNVDTHQDKNDLLQIIHLQASHIEMEYFEKEGLA